MHKRTGTSYSCTLALPRFATLAWSVLSTHHHACNLLANDGTLVAVVSEVHGNGPFHLVVPHARFDGIASAPAVQWRDSQLQLDHLVIDLRAAIPWHPQLPHLTNTASLEQLNQYAKLASTQSALSSGPAAVIERAQRGIQFLRQEFTQNDGNLIAQAVNLLSGLGPGLTPAGDDFLVGFMAALWIRDDGDARYRQFCRNIAEIAIPQTTRLSGAWLAAAGSGHFGEPWHELITALNSREHQQVDHAVHRITYIGATSGADALCGFLVGSKA